MGYSVEDYIRDLRSITGRTSDESEIISALEPLAKRLVTDKGWLKPEYYETDPEQGFGVHMLHEEPDHALAVFVVAWDPGRGAPPHDHGTWAVVAGIEGLERNTLYKRLDDRSSADHAKLDIKSTSTIGAGDVVSMKTGGIHGVVNETDQLTLSLHTYGKHLNYTGRSQFDLETNEKRDFLVNVN